MVLKFPSKWRFEAPKCIDEDTNHIPQDAINDFLRLIKYTATQGNPQDFLEHFKRHFCAANGTTGVISSNSMWAEYDLDSEMLAAAANPPLFIEAFFNASESIRKRPGDLSAPDAEIINEICRRHGIGYEIQGFKLVLRDPTTMIVSVPQSPTILEERAREILQTSLQRAENLLQDRRGREAVQDTLWLFETVATAFRDADTGTGTVEGKYFNSIVKDLRSASKHYIGTSLEVGR